LSRQDQLTVLTHVGWFLTATQSYAAPEVGRVFAFAETLCRDDTERFPVIRGLWVYRLVCADLDEADRRARRLLEIASHSGASEQLVEAHLAMGLTSVYKGDFNLCREHLQACLDLYDPAEHHINSFKYGNDPKATALAFDGFAAWVVGRPELAVSRCAEALEQAESVGHPFTITLILYVFTMVYQAIGDVESTRNYADRLITFCKRQGSSHFLSQGIVFRAWAEFRMGGGKLAVDKMDAGLKQHLKTGAIVTHTYHTALLAEALAALGSYDQALDLIRSGLKMIEDHGDRRWLADLHRVHGDLLAAKPEPEPEAALAAYNQSLDVARAQSAKSFELRTLVRMVRLLAGNEGAREAAASLARAYEAFEEGRDTADLKDAEALLVENHFRFAEGVQPIS
jgi:predicted ATPase